MCVCNSSDGVALCVYLVYTPVTHLMYIQASEAEDGTALFEFLSGFRRFRMPKEPAIRQNWINAIEKYQQFNYCIVHFNVCNLHFDGNNLK